MKESAHRCKNSKPSPQKNLKILYVGPAFDGSTSLHRLSGFRELGCEVESIETTLPFHAPGPRSLGRKVAKRLFLLTDPWIDWKRVSKKILNAAKDCDLDILWVDKGLGLNPKTLRRFSSLLPNVRCVSYSPDDMFNAANQSPRYLEALPIYDLHVTTKSYNVPEFKAAGAKDAFFIGNAYDPSVHRPLSLTADEMNQLCNDVVFVGSFEAERQESLTMLARNGFSLGVHGGGSEWLKLAAEFSNVRATTGFVASHDYSRLICGAKIALGFLRKQMRDLQTTRSVEIPACGTFMLAERTNEHLELFQEGREAEFFSCDEELLDKATYYLAHDDEREAIARRGRERCMRSGYSNAGRLRTVLEYIENMHGTGSTPG